jgi:hypothetical protein
MVGEGWPSTPSQPAQRNDVDGRPSPTMTLMHEVRPEMTRQYLGVR